jgi:hypothetical protein
MKKDLVKVCYDVEKELKKQLVIIAENKEMSQKDLVINYLKNGIKEDNEYLTSHLK